MQSRVLEGHSKGIKTSAWSPDSKFLISASIDHNIQIWDRNEGHIKEIRGHFAPIYFLAWSPQGDIFVSAEAGYGTGDGAKLAVINFWYKDGELLRAQKIPPIQTLSWSANGNFLATGSTDGIIRLWNEDGLPVIDVLGHEGKIYCLAWSPASNLLTSSGSKGEILFWDKRWNSRKVHQEGTRRDVTRLKWSPDGEILASYSGRLLTFWNEEGEIIQTLADIPSSSFAHSEDIFDIEWSPDANILASISWDRTIRLWDRDGDCFRILEIPDARSEAHILLTPRSLAWSSDSALLVSTYEDGSLRFWNLEGDCIGTAKLNSIRQETQPRRTDLVIDLDDFLGNEPTESFDDQVAWSPDGQILAIWEKASSSIVFLKWIIDRIDQNLGRTIATIKSKGIQLTKELDKCPICRQNYLETDEIYICRYCDAIFHISCISDWLFDEKHKICPRCNNLFIKK